MTIRERQAIFSTDPDNCAVGIMDFRAKELGATIAAIILSTTFLPAQVVSLADVEADIATIHAEMEAAREESLNYPESSVMWALSSMRRELLGLAFAALQVRKAGLDGTATERVELPVVEPDLTRAAEILVEMAAQEQRAADAEVEAASMGGIVGALATTRALTERAALAQLRLAYFQAAYGVAFPMAPQGDAALPGAVGATGSSTLAPTIVEGETTTVSETPEWADPAHPEIDYRDDRFAGYHEAGYRFSGWWALKDESSEIDDSPELIGINLSAARSRFSRPNMLYARCQERELAVIFLTDEFIMSDFRSDHLNLLVRFGTEPAREERWSELTSNKGAGKFGSESLPLMRELATHERVFLRITPRSGAPIDQIFELSGSKTALEEIANTCGEALIELGRNQYADVQRLLIQAGHLSGSADGVWGPASKQAMQAFQAVEGLPATGAIDLESLRALGLAVE